MSRTDRSGIELLNRPRPTQGCRVNRRRRRRSVRVCVRACTSVLPINTISFSTELIIASSQGLAALLLRFQFLCDVTL